MFYKAEFNECLLINVIKDIHTSAMSFWGNTCTVNVKGHHSIVIIKKLKHIFVIQLGITTPYLCTALSSDLLQDVFKTRCSVKLLTKLKETPQCTFHKIITPRSLNWCVFYLNGEERKFVCRSIINFDPQHKKVKVKVDRSTLKDFPFSCLPTSGEDGS